jgi:hypothetical protein
MQTTLGAKYVTEPSPMVGMAKREPPIAMELNNLAGSIDSLCENIEVLHAKLQPVMHPFPPVTDALAKEVGGSHLAQTLASYHNRIATTSILVRAMIESLEI